jgi:hypothetical protein
MLFIKIFISIALMLGCGKKKEPIITIYCVNNDIEILGKLIAAECSICSEEEQILIGMTVLNRVGHLRYPGSIEDVVFQEFQFTSIEHIDLDDYIGLRELTEDLIDNYIPTARPLYFVNKRSTNKKFLSFVEEGGFTKPYFYHVFK